MQLTITLLIVALAAVFAVRRLARALRRPDDCGCGRGGSCHNCPHHSHVDDCDHRLPALLVGVTMTALCAYAGLPHSAPAARGVSAEAIAALVGDLQKRPSCQLHHLVVVKDGFIVAEAHSAPFEAVDRHNQFSGGKMLTALAVGLAVEDGLFGTDDYVAELLADKCPAVLTPELSAMTVRHLLTMTGGKVVDTAIRDGSGDWAEAWLALPGIRPGKWFAYDTMAAYMLSVIVQRATGCTMLDYLQERILTPMGITDIEWEQSPDGINTGGWGVRAGTETMAMLGQLLLQDGIWDGRQLIDRKWIEQMTRDQLPALDVSSGNADPYYSGYGFQMWLCPTPNTFRAQGNYGQLVYVDRERQLVVAANCLTANPVLPAQVVSRHAPDLFRGADRDPRSEQRLELMLGQLKITPPPGHALDGQMGVMTVELSENGYGIKSLRLIPDRQTLRLELTTADGVERVALGHDRWIRSRLTGEPPYSICAAARFSGMDDGFHVAGRYACQPGGKIVLQLCYVDWYSVTTLTVDLQRNTVVVMQDNDESQSYSIACRITPAQNQKAAPGVPRSAWIAVFGLTLLAIVIAIVRAGR